MAGNRTTSDLRHRLAAVAAAAILAAALVPLVAGSGSAQEAGTTTQLDASTNVGAAVAWSEETYPDGAASAFIGRDDLFPDLLASGGAQGADDAPLLLTDQATLSAETADELERLGVTAVTILGGVNAVSDSVEDELAEDYTVDRLEGETRLETAVAIAEDRFPAATTAILARAFGSAGGDETAAFADALAAGGFAAAETFPVLLTETDELSDTTEAYFDDSAVTRVFVIGGPTAISENVVDELENDAIIVERLEGNNRFETAIAIAAERGFASADDAAVVQLIEGQADHAFASGFPAASFSATFDSPIVLANGDDLPPSTVEFLQGDSATPEQMSDVALVCGPFVTDDACEEATALLGTVNCDDPAPTPTATATASETDDGGLPIIGDLLPGGGDPSASPSDDPCAEDDASPTPTGTGTPTGTPSPTPTGSPTDGDELCLPIDGVPPPIGCEPAP